MRYSSGVRAILQHGRLSAIGLLACASLFGAAHDAHAQGAERPAFALPPGSPGFCLFEIPARDGTTRLANIVIVQFVDILRDRVRLTYGGGNFGSGYELDIPIRSREEGLDWVRRMLQAARECARPGTPAPASATPGNAVRIAPPITPGGSTSGADPVPGNR